MPKIAVMVKRDTSKTAVGIPLWFRTEILRQHLRILDDSNQHFIFHRFAQREPHIFREMYVSAPNPSFPPRHRTRSHTSTMPRPTRTPKLNE